MIRVICAFPGTGKSYLYNQYPGLIIDSDSSNWSWESPGVRHPRWPYNYVNYIMETIEANPDTVLFVSTHKEVIDCLTANKVPFVVVMPDHYCKEEYINRFRQRGSDEKFIDLIARQYNNFLADLAPLPIKIVLNKGEYLSDVVKVINDEVFIKMTNT